MKTTEQQQTAKPRRTMFTAAAVLLGLIFAQNLVRHCCGVSFDAAARWAGAALQGDFARFVRSLIVTLAPVALILLYVRFGEGRKINTAGFVGNGRKAVGEYLLGAGLGVSLIAASIGLAMLFGKVHFSGVSADFSLAPFLAAALLAMVNIREESLYRGWWLTSEATGTHRLTAVAVGSVAFGLVHCSNPGVTLLAVVNLMLLGLLLSMLFLLRGNIWVAAALHSAWNFAQGRIAGLPVSGIETSGSLLDFTAEGVVSGFGLEASPCTTVILLAATLLSGKKFIYLYCKKRN